MNREFQNYQQSILREESRKIKPDSDRSIFHPENPLHCPSVTSYLNQRTLKRCSLLTAIQPWKLFFQAVQPIYCHAKQILPSFQPSGWAGRRRARADFPSYTNSAPWSSTPWSCSSQPSSSTIPVSHITLNGWIPSKVLIFSPRCFFSSVWKASSLFLTQHTGHGVLCWSWRVLNRPYQEVQHGAVNSGTLFHLKEFQQKNPNQWPGCFLGREFHVIKAQYL